MISLFPRLVSTDTIRLTLAREGQGSVKAYSKSYWSSRDWFLGCSSCFSVALMWFESSKSGGQG